jgi:hypothetical protein
MAESRHNEMSHQPTVSIRNEIKEKQDEVSDYLSYLEPFGTRLAYVTIIGGAFAVLLNGEAVRTLIQGNASSMSGLLPLGAAMCSLAATIAASLHKLQVESRLSQLQKCAARMESLVALLDAHQLTEEAASKRFERYLEECPSIPHRRQFTFEAVQGAISEPHDGQVVQANFTASGSAQNIGKRIYLWLTVEIDDKIWPKESRLFVDIHGQWSQPVFEDGDVNQFGLSLWAVNSEADRKLQAWLDQGNRTRVFPELRPLPGMKRLARVRGLSLGS